MDLFSLVAKLTLDDSQYKQALSAAETQGEGFGNSFKDVIGGVASALTAAGITAAIKGIADQFARMISNTAQYADRVDKGSQRLGISTSAYQEWNHALQQSGASIDTVSRGIVNLNAAISGSATDKVSEALDALSIDPSEYKSTEDLLDAVFTALADMEQGAERDTLIENIFGRGGMELAAFLNSGSEGIKELRQEAHDLGLIMSGEDIANGVAYGDAVANLQAAIEAIEQQLVQGLIPFLKDAVVFATSLVTLFNGRSASDSLKDQFDQIDESMSAAFVSATEGETKTKTLIDRLFEMSDATGQCAGNLEVWKGVANELIKICPELAGQIDLETGSIKGQKDELYELTDAWFANARAQAVAQALEDKQTAIIKAQTSLVDKQIAVEAARADAVAKRQTAEAAYKQVVRELGLSGQAEYSDEVIAGLTDAELVARINNIYSRFSDWDKLTGNTGSYSQAANAGKQLGEATELASSLEAEIVTLQEQLESATAEYERYSKAANDYLKTIQDGLNGIPRTVNVDINLNDNTGLGYTPYGAWATNYYTQRYGGSGGLQGRRKYVTGAGTGIGKTGENLGGGPVGSHASGLNYVPFDGYMAELHRGETVLNQAQAREWRQGDGGIDTQALNRAVAEAVASAVSGIQINMDGAAVGNAVTKQVSANIYQAQLGRRYSPAW